MGPHTPLVSLDQPRLDVAPVEVTTHDVAAGRRSYAADVQSSPPGSASPFVIERRGTLDLDRRGPHAIGLGVDDRLGDARPGDRRRCRDPHTSSSTNTKASHLAGVFAVRVVKSGTSVGNPHVPFT